MIEASRLKKHLIRKGRVRRSDIMKAEDYAMTAQIPLEEALVFLELINLEDLGRALSELYKVPYRPLLETTPPEKAKKLVSKKLAEKWGIFPVDFDPQAGVLTLAIDNPKDMEKTLVLEGNLFAPHKVTYTVASDMEIRKAFEIYYLNKKDRSKPKKELKLPEDFTILPDEIGMENLEKPKEKAEALGAKHILLLEPELSRARAYKTLLELEGIKGVTWSSSINDAIKHIGKGTYDLLLVNGNLFKQNESYLKRIREADGSIQVLHYSNFSPFLLQQAYPYEKMSETLISMASFFISWVLKDHPKRLAEIRLCARYGKLLALRLGLSNARVDAIVLSAWLSIPELRRGFLESVKCPYPIGKIMGFGDPLKNEEWKTERTIFGMVKGYVEALADHPEIRGDLSAVREELIKKFPFPEDEPILESFLHLLREDQLLQDVGKLSGKILVVDPEIFEDSGITLRLTNDGYQVKMVKTVDDALNMLSETEVDAILSEIELPDGNGLDFCKNVKTQPSFHKTLFMVITEDATPGLAARSLEAGADDFFRKPVDLELLSLKLSRALIMKGRGRSQRGVSGSLNDMSLTDLVQILSAGDKDVVITFEGGMRKGKIFIMQGEVIHAETDTFTGEEAFYQLMKWKDVNFSVLPCDEFPERTITMSLMSLLMEGSRLMDEEAIADETLNE